MVLDKLGDSLKGTLQKIAGSVFVDERLINELVRDIQRALLSADVNVKLVFTLTDNIKKRITNEQTPASITKKEHLINIVYEELVKFLGEEEYNIDTSKKPFTLMLVGLFGSGKTTTAGKLGKHFQKRGLKVAMISTDTWRPAAFQQLKQVGDQVNLPVFGNPDEKDPVAIYNQFKDELEQYDIVIVDTAGRDALSDELIEEIKSITEAVQPDESMLVISADIGQTAEKQATAFHDTCNVKSVTITKLDGTAKGGGALSASAVSGAKVAFIGVGEHVDDLEAFNPKRFVGRLLGMGDIETLLEKAKEAIDEDTAEDLGKKFLKGEFNMLDLYEQMAAMKKMGPLSKVVDMIPGMGNMGLSKDMLEQQQGKIESWRYIMDSMTKRELEEPDTISAQRIDRIAKGSGRSISDIRELMKQYKQAKKMGKMMKNPKQMEKMMKKFGSGQFQA